MLFAAKPYDIEAMLQIDERWMTIHSKIPDR